MSFDPESQIETLERVSGIYDQEESLQTRLSFWGSSTLRAWFLERSYTLYQTHCDDRGLTGDAFPSIGYSEDITLPYAYLGGDDDQKLYELPALCAQVDHRGMVFYAQDKQGRHLAVKAISNNSEECRILQYLSRQPVPTSLGDFQHVLPVVDIVPFGRSSYSFAVMPRWGEKPICPFPSNMRDVLHFMHCLLKALAYLHEHRIAHGDISPSNVLVNHFGRHFYDASNSLRSTLRSQGHLTFALFDFSSSTMFPKSSSLDWRLPYQKSWASTPGHIPSDTMQGEFDYNPFLFDVGMLGITFCNKFQHLTPLAPMLAPFLDRMITRTLSRRFTASQALRFFEDQVYPRMTEEQLKASAAPCPQHDFASYEVYDRWRGLDPDFVQVWAGFREPPIPASVWLMRYLCDNGRVNAAIAQFRQTLHHIRRTILTFLPNLT